ncbi:CDP-glycerol glycerophosphotransferase family protein [Bacillus sp. sid0103]|uniref:CDP-glycerol glycerophosphotransferase family protein n=1 Tax=Bacillus sp. sid0103 TaxID=2856337 RepID=UPI001C48C3F6|nr:CDP-glycerol glycerophosphotransferase family protein [Bacillus sp. sid0103]MBV7505711.1 CDP-glycerol glycerophosphotransferase family protein [Bacillus sp. sid0103]
MKKIIKKIVSKLALTHKVKSVSIEDDALVIEYDKLSPSFLKRYVLLKDRKSGRRIQEPLSGKRIDIKLDDLAELTEDGNLDVFLTSYLFSRKVLRRTGFSSHLKLTQVVDEKNKSKIKITKTKKKNISIATKRILINPTIKELKNEGLNLYIEGTMEDFFQNKPAFAEVIMQRRDVKRRHSFKLDVFKQDHGDLYQFAGIIYPDKLKHDLVKNSRWDVILRVTDEKNKVLHQELINLQSYREFEREEDRYLVTIETDEEHVISLYATMGINSLALWYTDQAQFEKTYGIARGKTVFNEVSLSEPLDKQMVVFESFLGKNYSGNPKYVYEQMLRDPKYKNYTYVWSYMGGNPEDIPGNPILVNRETEEFYRYLAKAKYWVSNILFPVHRKREGNIYLQTWHGTPLKKLGWDIDIEGPEVLARENFYIESRNWDYLISANPYSSAIFRRAFKFEKEMLETGYPLNDIFYREDLPEKVTEIKEKLTFPKDKKVILYAPTWRDNEMVGSWEHSFQLKFDLDEFYEKLHSDYILVLRMHHLISDSLEIDEKYKGFVYDLSKYDDIQELYVTADILITDYSSVFFDYANSKKPMLFYAYDYEMYKENIRGFYLNMEEDLPGPVIQNDADLLEAIVNIDQVTENYQEKYEEFYQRYCSLEDGFAAKRVVDRVFQ